MFRLFLAMYLTTTVCFFSQNSSDTLYFGLSKKSLIDINSSDAQIAVELLVNHISETKFNNKIIAKFYDNFDDIVNAYRNKQIDLLAVLSQDYIKLKTIIELDAKFVTKRDGDVFLEYYFIANIGTKLVKPEDKNHKLLVFNSQGNDLPYVWLRKEFTKLNLGSFDEYFKSFEDVRNPSKALLPVFFNKADACILGSYEYRTMVELNPQIASKLNVVLKSPKYPTGVLCLRSDLEPVYKNAFIESISELSTTDKGKQILSLFKIDDNVAFREEYLNNLYELFDTSEKQ